MKKELFKYLKSYSCGTLDTNRLIVSAFLKENGIVKVKNQLISSLIIREEDSDFEQFCLFCSKYKIVTIEDLITAFEFVISPEEKVVTGAIYTPVEVREFIVEQLLDRIEHDSPTISDLACGCGGFLYTAAKSLKLKTNKTLEELFANNIFGVDLMGYSVTRSKILLSLYAIIEGEDQFKFEFNIYEGNSLSFDFSDYIDNFEGFELIVGNPPYVCSRNIDDETKKLLIDYSVSSTGHPDLYIPFFELGINNLKSNGHLGYITMNTFFKSLNGRGLREYFDKNQYDMSILDFGGVQVFDARSTYTCICLIQKRQSNLIRYKRVSRLKKLSLKRMKNFNYEQLDSYNGWNFLSYKTIQKIESTGKPFGEVFQTSSGIATLKNNVFILTPRAIDDEFYYLDSDTKIERSICTSVLNPNKFIRSNDANSIKKVLIFPYTYQDKSVRVITESMFQKEYPFAYEYLKAHKDDLAKRDKGKGKYPEWFAFGRTQGLEKYKYKLLFPHITPIIPNYVLTEEKSLFFHNGMGLVSNEKESLILAEKIMSSKLFWFYIVNTSKPYGSGYFSLSRNYIKSFGVYDFTAEQKAYLLNETNQELIDRYLEDLYGINLPTESI